jgi:hypothetical protein
MSDIKNSQLTRVGYEYQDLMCIQILVNWFHNPSLYDWVGIEGSEDTDDLKGLDDVVACTKDGQYELYQVKFTTDAARADLTLSFDWLLAKKGTGTSLLQKWGTDFSKYSAEGKVAVASLRTNRKPDSDVEACLQGNKIDLDKIPARWSSDVIDHLGGYDKAKSFFELFAFEHSQPKHEDLEYKMMDSLVPDHSTREDWLGFLKIVGKWASRKNQPAPDGKIRLQHLHRYLSASTRSIPQYFQIPESYTPPTREFHATILEKVQAPGCWVVSGLPGMGKSTYLSFLTEELEKTTYVVRHHYWLASHSGEDRINFGNAARSLQHQLRDLFPELFSNSLTREIKPEEIDLWVADGAKAAQEKGKVLVVIVDGLDHVHRERAANIEQLTHLISRLAPLSTQACLILGTQPVSESLLPTCLAKFAPRDTNWIDLPLMGLPAIGKWVEAIDRTDNNLIGGDENYRAHEIEDITKALHTISHGYPLHIHYSLQYLIHTEGSLRSYLVQ